MSALTAASDHRTVPPVTATADARSPELGLYLAVPHLLSHSLLMGRLSISGRT